MQHPARLRRRVHHCAGCQHRYRRLAASGNARRAAFLNDFGAFLVYESKTAASALSAGGFSADTRAFQDSVDR